MPESIYTNSLHTIRLLMFYSSPLIPSSEIDLFLNRNLFEYSSLFFYHTHTHTSHLPTYIHQTSSYTKKLLQHILKYCVPFGTCINALLIGVYLCSKCLRVLTYVLFLCVFCVGIYDVTAKYKYNSQCYHNHDEMKWYWQCNAKHTPTHGSGGTMKNVLPIYWCGKVTWCLFLSYQVL